jgi:hypothetical protein
LDSFSAYELRALIRESGQPAVEMVTELLDLSGTGAQFRDLRPLALVREVAVAEELSADDAIELLEEVYREISAPVGGRRFQSRLVRSNVEAVLQRLRRGRERGQR